MLHVTKILVVVGVAIALCGLALAMSPDERPGMECEAVYSPARPDSDGYLMCVERAAGHLVWPGPLMLAGGALAMGAVLVDPAFAARARPRRRTGTS
ncbi:hypothetical protein SAMN05421803_101702 [Nocardiopsis flavescens]|uniref:Uncharacterized protein n=1 Tax=Nocardiopsis flavescens TaxID=758803 RepID=A0A1M6CGV0_9ACTN|nr:hypothetical protein [Nocardiopsis flavescens]SHI60237.1 hypothetical protein SAMN05421803_101702 [Nocardiopsis flavescens]